MKWTTGNWTSYPDDGRAFVERDGRGWWVYPTDEEGTILVTSVGPDGPVFAPPLLDEPLETVEAAHEWVEANVPAR